MLNIRFGKWQTRDYGSGDYNRVKNGDNPIFCIRNLAGIIMDGGTIEYFGLGYKIIDFNMLNRV